METTRIRRSPGRSLRTIAVAALASLLSLPAQDERRVKLAGTKESYNASQHEARRARFFRDALLADYRARCSEESPADPEAERLLRLYAECWEGDRLDNDGDRRRLLHLAQRVFHRGCEDPLVLLAAGDAAYMHSQFAIAEPLLRGALDELEAGSGSVNLKRHAMERMYSFVTYRRIEKEVETTQKRCDDLLVDSIADPAFGNGNERFYLELVFKRFQNKVPASARWFVDRLAKVDDAHRYPLLMIQGYCHLAEGWAARGTGVARSVTEEGWDSWGKHLTEAARCFAEAHVLAPAHPEAPTAMVNICGALSLPDEERDEWFDLVLNAQFDYGRAHYHWLYYSLPRWGGTHVEMMKFGLDCAATERFDTTVPNQFRTALSYISWDYDDVKELYGTAIVQKTLQAVHDGYLRELRSQSGRVRELSEQAVLLWLGNRAEDAAELYQSIDGEFDESVFARYRARKAVFTEVLEPHLKPHAPKRVADFDVFEGFATTKYDASYEPRPIPIVAGALTAMQRQRQQAEWTKEVCLAAYGKHGKKDDKWDADAEAFLTTYGRLVAEGGDEAAATAHRDQAKTLLDAGCDDPMILYVAGRAYEYAVERERAIEILERSMAGLRDSGYSKAFAYYATRRLESLLRSRNRTEEADALRPRVLDHAIAMAADPCFAGDNARYYVTNVVPLFDIGWAAGPMTEEGIERMSNIEGVDPWIHHTMAGLVHTAAASAAPIELISSEKREAYFAHVRKAAEHLLAAHSLRPEFPEPAAAMIILRMMEPGPRTPRAWFDLAVAAQFDYEVAYRNFLWAMRPDWCGSPLAMYRFGVECLDTGAYHTVIPLYFLRALESLAPFLDNWRWAWSSPDSAARYETLAQGIIAARPGTPMATYVDVGRYLTAWAGGRYSDAVAGWRAANESIDPLWLRRMRVEKEQVEKDLRALTGK